MNAFAKIRKALNTGDANDILTAMAALAELERAAAEPACIVESARIEGPTICRRLMWMREVGAGEKLYTTPPPAQPAPKFEAPEVDDEIARKLWREWFDAGCMTGLDTARFWLRVWQRELGPTLGMVPPDARADARIAELERECSQWREELRIYREAENARIAELEQSVTVRDAEIARLETDLELARRDHASALRLVTDIRFALGDNGKRMQPGFVEWCRELRADAERMNWLEASTFSPVTRAAIDVARDGHQGNSDDDR